MMNVDVSKPICRWSILLRDLNGSWTYYTNGDRNVPCYFIRSICFPNDQIAWFWKFIGCISNGLDRDSLICFYVLHG